MKLTPARERIGRRAALEFKEGMSANLGIGIPTLAADFAPNDLSLVLQSENGLLGIGRCALQHQGQIVRREILYTGFRAKRSVLGAAERELSVGNR